MKFHPVIALLVCAALVSPGAAQTRIAAGIARGPASMSAVPALGGFSSPRAPCLNGGLLAASLAGALPVLPAPALAVVKTVEPRALKNAVGAHSTGRYGGQSPPPLAAARERGEQFWSGAAAKDGTGDSLPVAAASAAKRAPFLARGAFALPPLASALPALPHWAAPAVPYVEAVAALAGAYALTRVSRWAIDKLAPRLGWDKNAVVLARFISSAVLWTAGAGAGLALLGLSGTVLLAAAGASGTVTALAVTLVVHDVAGNAFHSVHFLISRPFTVGDKVTIGKTTGIVSDLTLRYLVLQDENGGFVLHTYNKIAATAVKLYGGYLTKEQRLSRGKPAFARGLLRALRDAASPALWKPLLFSALAIALLAFLPMLPAALKGASLTWLTFALPFLKVGIGAFLTHSLSRSIQSGVERLGTRYNWALPAMRMGKLGAAALTWLIGGAFLLNAAGVSWAWVIGTLSLSTVLVSIAITDYVNSVFQGALVLALKPFSVGDRVTIGDNAGAVVDITLRYVVLKLDDESFMLIPHSVVKDSAIITPREYGRRRQ